MSMGLLRQPPTLLFGRGQRHALPSALPVGSKAALVITDARMAQDRAFTDIVGGLNAVGVHTRVYSDVQPELPSQDAISAAALLADQTFDVIVSVGGGSCIDFSKVLAILLRHGGTPQDYYGEFAVPGPVLPLIAIPTTAGTGAEATPVAVVTDSQRQTKMGISSPYLIPDVAICDPELSDGAPPSLMMAAGVDALSHAIESFTAVRRTPTSGLSGERVFVGSNLLTDKYALGGIQAVGDSLSVAVNGHENPKRLMKARDDMVFAALAGGLALGSGGTAGAHALQYPVGAATHTPHGIGIAVLLPYVMEFNRPSKVSEFAQIARALGAEEQTDDETLSHLAIELVDKLLTDIDAPKTLAAIGMPAGKEGWIAAQALRSTRLIENNPRRLDAEQLEIIAAAAYTGNRASLRSAAANT